MAEGLSFYRADQNGLVITARVLPKASRDGVQGVMATPEGQALKIAVTAPPDKGKANAAVAALLAKSFGVAKSSVTVVAGETDRRKVIRISGDPAALIIAAQQWIKA
jgi:uncharacterized protein (TIGR00251 family)